MLRYVFFRVPVYSSVDRPINDGDKGWTSAGQVR